MKMQLVRHATHILEIDNKKILVDPMLSPKGTMAAIEGVPNTSNNPLVDLPMELEQLLNFDAILVTHTHRDHFDDHAMKVLPKDKPLFCQPEDKDKITALGFKTVIEINDSYNWKGINLKRTCGKHGHGLIAVKMAPVSGFIITSNNEPAVYITGDTIWYSKTKAVALKYSPDVVICYAGEARFSKGKPITMNDGDIKSLCDVSPDIRIVAIHMEAWNHCRLSRGKLREFTILNKIQDRVYIPKDGEILEF